MSADARDAAGRGRARPDRAPRAALEEADKRPDRAVTSPGQVGRQARQVKDSAAQPPAGAADHAFADRSARLREQADTGAQVREDGQKRQARHPADPNRWRQKEP